MIRKISLLAAAGVMAATAVWAGSHSTPEGQAIAARKSQMQLYQFNAGILGGMARGNIEYNAEAAAAAASNLAALTATNQMAYWPAGSDNGAVENTRALPALWADFAGAGKIIGDLSAAAAALAGTAGDGVEAVQAGIGPVFAACTACHTGYRQAD